MMYTARNILKPTATLVSKTLLQHSKAHYARIALCHITSAPASHYGTFPYSMRNFSSTGGTMGTVADGVPTENEVIKTAPGTVTRTLRVLDMQVVKKILAELRSVDVDANGRLDTDELKQLLRKHNSAFTEDEINEIGEMFYAGKAGGSVPFDRFVEAIDRVVQEATERNRDYDDEPVGNPLGLHDGANEFVFINRHNYTSEELDVKLTHVQPETFRDRIAFNAAKALRFVFDKATGWNYGNMTRDKVLNRVIFLETVAAVPGMVAAIVRHFRSLRTMQRDGGMLHMFLDEAHNERMHLLSFVRLKDPDRIFRFAVIAGQFGFGSIFMLTYIVAPRLCHRFVGYIEEEACTTYTKIIEAVETAPEGSELAAWRTQVAPRIARGYWKLGEEGTVLDLIYAVRADEAEHRDVNHLCSVMEDGEPNPVSNTEKKLNTMLLKYVNDLMEREDRTKLQN